MEKKTIGKFIAALRRANGMTQRELGERLFVSDKTVSRWECDECTPELSLIPAIAELFGITADELLRGERDRPHAAGEESEEGSARARAKVEKQLRNLVRGALSRFKTMIGIALALVALGMVFLFGISYGFYRPVIGFAALMLFEIGALFLTFFALTRVKESTAGHELWEEADPTMVAALRREVSNYSFVSFFAVAVSLLLALPLLLARDAMFGGVLSFRSYVTIFLGVIVLLSQLLFLKGRAPYARYIWGIRPAEDPLAAGRRALCLWQSACLIAGAALLLGSTWISHSLALLLVVAGGVACLIAVIVLLFVFARKEKGLLLVGLRQVCLLPAPFLLSQMHSLGFFRNTEHGPSIRYDHWNERYLLAAVLWTLAVLAVFALIDELRKRKGK